MEKTFGLQNKEHVSSVIAWGHDCRYSNGKNESKRLHGNSYKFIAVTNGTGTIYINDIPYRVSSGDVCNIYPFEYYSIETGKDENLIYDYINLTVSDKQYSAILGSIWIENIKAGIHVFQNKTVSEFISQIVDEKLDESRLFSSECTSLLITSLILCIIRQFPQSTNRNLSTVRLFCDTVSFIDANFYSIKSLSDISDALGYSYDYISKVFKKMSGISIEAFHRTKKLDIAKKLLLEGMKITDVSKKLGYSTVQSFSKSFHNHWGYSPRKYVKQWVKE